MLNVKTYEGESQELADFVTPIWRESYAGKRLIPDWNADFFDWQLLRDGQGARDYLLAVYDGSKLIGTLLAEPFRFWSSEHGEFDACTGSWLTIDPAYRRLGVASKLVAELKQRLGERNAAFLFGFIIRGTSGEEYWRRQTGAVTLGELGFWCRVFDVKAVRNCSYMSAFDRWFFSFLPAFQNPHPQPSDRNGTRRFQDDDLPRCLELINAQREGMDLSFVWSPSRLTSQLQYEEFPRTIVYEERNQACGFINYHLLDFVGRGTLRAAVIDLLAFGSMSIQARKKMLRAAMAQMIEEGAAMALLLRVPSYPAHSIRAAGFFPLEKEFEALYVFGDDNLSVDGFKRLNVYLR